MKFGPASQALLFVASAVTLSSGVWAEEETRLRGLQGKGNAYGRMKKPCTILAIADLKIPGYESSGVRGLQSGSDPNGADEEFVCELDPDDAPNGHANQVVRFNLDESQKKKMHEGLYSGDLVSGSSTYYDPDAEVSSDEVSPGKGNGNGNAFGWTKNGKADEGRRLGARTGDVRYLVVRVTDSGGLVRPESAAQIGDDVFGTLGDPVNLKSQAKACSYDQINIIPGGIHPGDEVAPGVIEVSVNLSLTNTDRYAFHNAVTAAVNTKLGISLPGPYEQVLYVLEKCYIECGWAAYAYINSWMSVYQNAYYKHTGVLMHELGHNWGMAHSGGLNGATYTDHTGLMGNPLYDDDVGRMCFNPAKNWYVGWYDDAKTLLDPLITSPWKKNIVGIADYGNNPENNSVVIKIETGTSTDYFIGFNRATGINSDNDEADNEVIIVETGNNGEAYSQSFLKAHLIQGESYTFLNWKGTGEDLVITANDINISANPGYANIEIQLGTQTDAPTKAPTPVPNVAPTTSPTSSPTGSPTKSPTKGPTTSPTSSPTGSPTGSPTKGPTKAPTPTTSPTSSPTGSPTGPPTKAPTASPTISPTALGICEGCPDPLNEGELCALTAEGDAFCCTPPAPSRQLFEQNERRLCIEAGVAGCSNRNQCCPGSTCTNAGRGVKRCVATSTPAPTPTPPVPCHCIVAGSTPTPTPPPVPQLGCAQYTGGGDCGRAGGCYWEKGRCYESAGTTPGGGADFCSGKGGYCSGDDDCCGSSNCKGNSRCS